jgi:hypothetical protein
MPTPFRNVTILAALHDIGEAYGVSPAAQCDILDPHAAFCVNQVALLAGLHANEQRRRQALAEMGQGGQGGQGGERQLGPLSFGERIPILPEANVDQEIDLKGLGL